MSKISDAYNELNTILGTTLFPSKVQLSDAINPDQNTEGALANGYGIRIGPAINTNRNLGCKLSVERDIVIILTSRSFANQLRTDEKYDAFKDILEDHFILIKQFEKNPDLSSSQIAKFRYESDRGIENLFVGEEKQSFIKIETIFKMEYFEDITI